MSTSPERPADPVGLVLRGLGFGITLGAGAQALVTYTVRTMQQEAPPAPPSLTSGPVLLLLLGTLTGIVAAGTATWMLLAPIRNPWRQAMLAVIAGLGSFVLSLVTIPIDRAWGRPGLLGLAILAAAGCLAMGRRLSAAGASGSRGDK